MSQQLVRLDVPLRVGVSVLVLVLALDGRLNGFDGMWLVGGLIAYTIFAIREGRRQTAGDTSEGDGAGRCPADGGSPEPPGLCSGG